MGKKPDLAGREIKKNRFSWKTISSNIVTFDGQFLDNTETHLGHINFFFLEFVITNF